MQSPQCAPLQSGLRPVTFDASLWRFIFKLDKLISSPLLLASSISEQGKFETAILLTRSKGAADVGTYAGGGGGPAARL